MDSLKLSVEEVTWKLQFLADMLPNKARLLTEDGRAGLALILDECIQQLKNDDAEVAALRQRLSELEKENSEMRELRSQDAIIKER